MKRRNFLAALGAVATIPAIGLAKEVLLPNKIIKQKILEMHKFALAYSQMSNLEKEGVRAISRELVAGFAEREAFNKALWFQDHMAHLLEVWCAAKEARELAENNYE